MPVNTTAAQVKAAYPYAGRRDRLGTTHHDAGTLFMGTDPATSVAVVPSVPPLTRLHHCQEYVYLIAKRVSRTCGGLAGAILANCVPTL